MKDPFPKPCSGGPFAPIALANVPLDRWRPLERPMTADPTRRTAPRPTATTRKLAQGRRQMDDPTGHLLTTSLEALPPKTLVKLLRPRTGVPPRPRLPSLCG